MHGNKHSNQQKKPNNQPINQPANQPTKSRKLPNQPTHRTNRPNRPTDRPTNQPTPRSRVLLEKLKVLQLRNSLYFMELEPHQLSLSWARVIQARFPILFPYSPTYSQVFQAISFLQVSEPKPCGHFSSPPICHISRQSYLLYLITQSMRGRKYNS